MEYGVDYLIQSTAIGELGYWSEKIESKRGIY